MTSIERVCGFLKSELSNLDFSLYYVGSHATGESHSDYSDIDLLLILQDINDKLFDNYRVRIKKKVACLSKKSKPISIRVITKSDQIKFERQMHIWGFNMGSALNVFSNEPYNSSFKGDVILTQSEIISILFESIWYIYHRVFQEERYKVNFFEYLFNKWNYQLNNFCSILFIDRTPPTNNTLFSLFQKYNYLFNYLSIHMDKKSFKCSYANLSHVEIDRVINDYDKLCYVNLQLYYFFVWIPIDSQISCMMFRQNRVPWISEELYQAIENNRYEKY